MWVRYRSRRSGHPVLFFLTAGAFCASVAAGDVATMVVALVLSLWLLVAR